MSLLDALNINVVDDHTRIELMKLMKKMSKSDPEFILKVYYFTDLKCSIRHIIILFIICFIFTLYILYIIYYTIFIFNFYNNKVNSV